MKGTVTIPEDEYSKDRNWYFSEFMFDGPPPEGQAHYIGKGMLVVPLDGGGEDEPGRLEIVACDENFGDGPEPAVAVTGEGYIMTRGEAEHFLDKPHFAALVSGNVEHVRRDCPE